MTPENAKVILEAVLLCAPAALPEDGLRDLFDDPLDPQVLKQLLQQLQQDWNGRGIELQEVAGGWRFQSRPGMLRYLERMAPEKPPRYSRAAMEVLAVIAYQQPVTRGDIEELRGVGVSTSIMRQFLDRGWVETVGHRDTVGRPALYATTRQFLQDLGLKSLADLPARSAAVVAGASLFADGSEGAEPEH